MPTNSPIELRYVLAPDTFAQIQSVLATDRQRLQYRFVEAAKCPGVYTIWWQHRCLYVGRSTEGTVYNRLCSHMARCQNDELKQWIEVKGDRLRFSFVYLDDIVEENMISAVEIELINSLDAELNIQRDAE